MARKIAEERFKGMPGTLRDLLRAQLSGKLIERDGSPADIQEGVSTIQTFDRTWRVPTDAVSHRSTYFKNARGNVISYKIIESNIGYMHTIGLVNLCARVLGKAETVNLILSGDKETQADEVSSILSKTETVHPTPSGDGETRVDEATSDNSTDEMVGGTEEVPSIQTALGYTTREGADSPPEKVLAHGQTALGKMSAEQRRAWLAENMGFCFTEDGATAYRSERTANENAVHVDAQGKVRKLSEVTGQNPPGWEAATSAARLSGYNVLTASYREQIRWLAVQTSANILTSIPPELRRLWLAERNNLFFRSSPGNPYREEECVLESGIKISFQGSDYEHCLYYNPSGKIVNAFDIGREWNKRWCLPCYCEVVVGINAINESFRDEVETMRNASRKSASYQNGTSGSNLSQER